MKKTALHKKLSEFYELNGLSGPKSFGDYREMGPSLPKLHSYFFIILFEERMMWNVHLYAVTKHETVKLIFLCSLLLQKKNHQAIKSTSQGATYTLNERSCFAEIWTLSFNVTAKIKLLYLGFWLSFLHIVTANLHSGSKHSFGKFGDWDSKQMANFLGNCEKTYSMNPTRKPENIRHNLLFKCQTWGFSLAVFVLPSLLGMMACSLLLSCLKVMFPNWRTEETTLKRAVNNIKKYSYKVLTFMPLTIINFINHYSLFLLSIFIVFLTEVPWFVYWAVTMTKLSNWFPNDVCCSKQSN